ncbi:FHA domain-containing protein PS1 [Linum grandiflorum]
MQNLSATAAMVEEREATTTTPQKEAEVKFRNSDEVREGLSRRMDGGGVAQKVASEEFSCEEVSEMEEDSFSTRSGVKMPVLDEDSEVKMPQKEDAEHQSRDSEEVFSSEKEDEVSQMVEKDSPVRSELQPEVHASLESLLPDKQEDDVVGETENQCLLKDCEQKGMPLTEGNTPQIYQYVPFPVGKEEIGRLYRKNDEPVKVSQLGMPLTEGNTPQIYQYVPFPVGKEEIGRLYRKNDEPVKVSQLGIGSPACPPVNQEALPVIKHEEAPVRSEGESSYLKQTNSDCEPSVMYDQEHSETTVLEVDSESILQQVLFLEEEEEEEETAVPLRNDNELTEVSYLGTGDSEYYSMKDSLAEGGSQDVSVLFQGESSEVANLYSSLLFAAVKAHLDREISLMKNQEHLEAARLEVNVSLTVENLLEADQQKVCSDGKDETRSLVISELDCASSSMKNQEGLESGLSELGCESSPMKNQEGLEIALSGLECESSPMKNLVGLETGLSELEGESSPMKNPEGLETGLSESEGESSTMKNQEGLETGLSELDCESSPMKNQKGLETDLSELDSVNSYIVEGDLSRTESQHISLDKEDTEVTKVHNLFSSDENLLEAREEISSLPSSDNVVAEVASAVQTDFRDDRSSLMTDQKHLEIGHSDLNSGNLPLMIETLSEVEFQEASFVGKEDNESWCKDGDEVESGGGNEHEKYDELTRSPELYSIEDAVTKEGNKNGSADLEIKNAEFDELMINHEGDSAEDGPPKRSSTESLELDISTEDLDSLLVAAATEADSLTSMSLEADSNDLTETSELGADNVVVLNDKELTFDEQKESSGGHAFEEASPKSSPLRSQMEVSDVVDLDSIFLATVESDFNSKTPLKEDQRHLDMCVFDVESFSVSSKVENLDAAAPVDQPNVSESSDEQQNGGSTETSFNLDSVEDQKQKELSLVNNVSYIQESLVDGQDQQSTEEQKQEMHQLQDHSSTEKPQVNENGNIQESLVDEHNQQSTEEQKLEMQDQVNDNGVTTICSVSVVTESISSSLSMEEILSEIMENEENRTPQSVQSLEDGKSESVKLVKRTSVQRIWLRKGEPASAVQIRKSKSMENIKGDAAASSSAYKEGNGARSIQKLPPSTDSESKKENFTPGKENRTPNIHLPSRTRGKLEGLKSSSLSPKITVSSKILTEGEKESSTPKEIHQELIDTPSTSATKVKLGLQLVLRDRMGERIPLQNLIIRSPVLSFSRASLGSASTGTPGSSTEQPSINSTRGRKKRWIMVADTLSLLDNESRKSLQLLQGLRGTRLIIPRIVKSELDSLKTAGRLFRRTTEAAKVLEWIEECKSESDWWIHVQSSVELSPLSTPPASSPEAGPASKRWYSPFSASNNVEMASPRPEDHVLSSALLYKKLHRDGKQVVLISKDENLKIKATAEGLICETAQEFRSSLVNPFSERFLWAESSPRGQTWSVKDDVVLKERFYQSPIKKKLTAQGLKLVLLDESRDGFPIESIRTV